MRFILALAMLVPIAAQADDLLEQILRHLGESPVVRGEFVQERFLRAIARPTVSSGSITVSRAEGVLWRIESPVQVALAFTPTQVIETGADGVRRVRGERRGTQAEMARVMRGILGADVQALSSSFEARAEGSVERWRIRLVPRAREMGAFLKAINLAGARHLETIEIQETSGDRTAIRMRGFTIAAELAADEREYFRVP